MATNRQPAISCPETEHHGNVHQQRHPDVSLQQHQIEQQPQLHLQHHPQQQHQLYQHKQTEQQHAVSMDPHQPQHTDSQEQCVVDQLMAFAVGHLGPGVPISSSNSHDAGPNSSNSNSIKHAHQNQQATEREQEVISSPQAVGVSFSSIQQIEEMDVSSVDERHQPTLDQPTASASSEEPDYIVVIEPPQKVTQSLSLKVTEYGIGGVIAEEMIEKGAEFGPYTGTLLSEDEGWSKNTTWEICISGRVFFYIDGQDTWMSNLQCAQTEEEQNIEAFQYYGEIYFRTIKVVEPGSELKVFYSEDYGKRVGIETRLNDLKFNHDAGKFQCSQCEGLFSSVKLLLRHVRCEHSQDEVDDAIPTLVWMKKTQKITQKKPPEEIIKTDVTRKQNSTTTKKPVRKVNKFKCGTCKKFFSSLGQLKEHETFHDFDKNRTRRALGRRDTNVVEKTEKKSETTKKKSEAQVHKCEKCSKTFTNERTLLKHIQDFGESHGYQCRICSERFSNKKLCKKHEVTHKRRKSKVEEEPSDKPKDMLGKSFNYYKGHFKCRVCPRYFSLRRSAKYHEKEMHSGELDYKCSICQKSFPKKSRLIDHVRNHEENRIYRCTLCPRSFASQSAFDNHQGEHTGLKPHKCDICGKGFKTKQSVGEHKARMHQEQKIRFSCLVCNKGFSSKGNLTKHVRRHKGIRPFVCLECGKPFTAKGALRNHIQAIHSKEKAFICEVCGKSFALDQTYTLHMYKHREKGEVMTRPVEQSEVTQAINTIQE